MTIVFENSVSISTRKVPYGGGKEESLLY